jgi:hypothetical protein
VIKITAVTDSFFPSRDNTTLYASITSVESPFNNDCGELYQVWRSTDGGLSWAQITTVPTPNPFGENPTNPVTKVVRGEYSNVI